MLNVISYRECEVSNVDKVGDYSASSNSSFLGLLIAGAGITSAGLQGTESHLRATETQCDSHGRASHRGRITHDDALGDASNTICLAKRRRVEQVVGCLLERSQHEHAVLHLRHTESRDTQYFALIKQYFRLYSSGEYGSLPTL